MEIIIKNMHLVTRVKGSLGLLKWLPPYGDNKTKRRMPVVYEWLLKGVLEALIMA